MEIDPYQTLELPTTATPLEIKRQYKKLSLQYHPDKIQQLNSKEDAARFPEIQFAYSILSDANKRRLYDTTGSLGLAADATDDAFDWKEYFRSTTEKITIDMIEEDRLKYQGLAEERDDILRNFLYYEGDFLKLFEVIPHLEFDETQESRVFGIVEDAVAADELTLDKSMASTWQKYQKSRKTKVKQVLKKMAREAQDASRLAKKLGQQRTLSEGDLKALIQKRNLGRMDSLILGLEAKYGNPKGKKRGPLDEEFEKIQEKMLKNRKKGKAN